MRKYVNVSVAADFDGDILGAVKLVVALSVELVKSATALTAVDITESPTTDIMEVTRIFDGVTDEVIETSEFVATSGESFDEAMTR